jgi:hypothetical protein
MKKENLWIVNLIVFFIGEAGLWQTTHSWVALGWGFIAALHFSQNDD